MVTTSVFSASTLLTQLDLIAEGEAMAHCLASFDANKDIEAGRLLLFAVRGPERLTMSLGRWPDDGMWELVDLAGKANAPPSVDALLFAHAFVGRLNEAQGRTSASPPPAGGRIHGDADPASREADAGPESEETSEDEIASRREARGYNADLYLKVAATLGRKVPIRIWMGRDWRVALESCVCRHDEHVLMHWRTTADDASGTLLLHGGNTRRAECFVDERGSRDQRKGRGATGAPLGFVMHVMNGRVRYQAAAMR